MTNIGMVTYAIAHEYTECINMGDFAENYIIQVSAISSDTIIAIGTANPGQLTPADQMLTTPGLPQNFTGFIVRQGETFQFTARGIGSGEWVLWGYAGSSTADSLISVSIQA